MNNNTHYYITLILWTRTNDNSLDITVKHKSQTKSCSLSLCLFLSPIHKSYHILRAIPLEEVIVTLNIQRHEPLMFTPHTSADNLGIARVTPFSFPLNTPTTSLSFPSKAHSFSPFSSPFLFLFLLLSATFSVTLTLLRQWHLELPMRHRHLHWKTSLTSLSPP